MASSKEYLDFVLENCRGLSARSMMGEYVLYYGGKVIGGIYDNRLLIKITPSATRLLPNAPRELPYPGAKEMIVIEDVCDREKLCELLESVCEELPCRKEKSKK